MTVFAALAVEGAQSGVRCLRAGAGAPVVVLQTDEAFGPNPVYDLLAEHCEVTLAAPGSSQSLTADTLADLTRRLGYERCSIVCDGGSAVAGLNHALAAPEAVERLVLKAPRLGDVHQDYARIETPVLVLESSRIGEGESGQKLAAVIPDCYHVFVYDASETLSGDRPEAVADVLSDFVERGGRFIVSKPAGMIHP